MDQRFISLIKQRIEDGIRVKQSLADQAGTISLIAGLIVQSLRNGGKLLLFGNGGSAADAQHIAAEFVGRYYMERKPLPALALNVNASCLTAIGNDYSFDEVFARQLEALGNTNDIAIGITTSGNSRNVIEGMRAARNKGMITIGLTGHNGGLLKSEADYCIFVPSEDTPRIQEGHIFIGHILAELVERELFSVVQSND